MPALNLPRTPNTHRPRALYRRFAPVVAAVLAATPLAALPSAARAQVAPYPGPRQPAVAAPDPAGAAPTIDSTRQALEAARKQIEDLQARMTQDQKSLADLTQRLTQGDADLVKQRQELEQADRDLQARGEAVVQARARFEAAKAAYDSAWRGAIADFESGEAFRTAKAAAEAATADAAAAEESALKQLAGTDAFRRAKEEAARAEERARTLTNTQPTTDPDRADASQTAAEAKARLADLQSRYLSEDARVQETRRRARETGVAFDTLRQEFGRQLPQLPAVTTAQAALDAARSAADAAPAEVQQAQSRRDALAAAFRQASDAAEPDRTAARNLQAELNDLGTRFNQARADADRAQQALESASAAARSNQADEAPQSAEARPSAPAYNPAPDVDVPPADPGPVVVQPYRYPDSYTYTPPVYVTPPVVSEGPTYYYDSGPDIYIRGGSGWYGGRTYREPYDYSRYRSPVYRSYGSYEGRRDTRAYGEIDRGVVPERRSYGSPGSYGSSHVRERAYVSPGRTEGTARSYGGTRSEPQRGNSEGSRSYTHADSGRSASPQHGSADRTGGGHGRGR